MAHSRFMQAFIDRRSAPKEVVVPKRKPPAKGEASEPAPAAAAVPSAPVVAAAPTPAPVVAVPEASKPAAPQGKPAKQG